MSTLQNDRDRIVELFADTVWCVALSRTGREEAAQEVFQEVFLRYFEKERIYENDEHRKAWLIRTTLICCQRYLSSYFRDNLLPLEEVADLSTQEIEESGELYTALLRLPPKYRIPIVLYYLEELPTEQCLQILKLKPAAFRKRLSRGRELLKKYLKGEDYLV